MLAYPKMGCFLFINDLYAHMIWQCQNLLKDGRLLINPDHPIAPRGVASWYGHDSLPEHYCEIRSDLLIGDPQHIDSISLRVGERAGTAVEVLGIRGCKLVFITDDQRHHVKDSRGIPDVCHCHVVCFYFSEYQLTEGALDACLS